MLISEILDKKPSPSSRTTTLALLGQKGVGKTRAMAILGEYLDCQAVYFDTIGAFTDNELVTNAMYITVDDIHPKKLIETLDIALQKNKRAVLDMRYLIAHEKVLATDHLSRYIMSRGNIAVLYDELSFVCPQNQRVYSHEFHRLVMAGRNNNVVPIIFSTQRAQTLHKDVLALADKYIFFRLLHNLDRNTVKQIVGLKKDEWAIMEEEIMKLNRQEAFLFYIDRERIMKKLKFPNYYSRNEVKQL